MGIKVNLYKLHFLFSYFSLQPNRRVFHLLTFLSLHPKYRREKIKYFLSFHFSIVLLILYPPNFFTPLIKRTLTTRETTRVEDFSQWWTIVYSLKGKIKIIYFILLFLFYYFYFFVLSLFHLPINFISSYFLRETTRVEDFSQWWTIVYSVY